MPTIRIAHLDSEGREAETGYARPLPVHDGDRETQARNADPLIVSTLTVGATQRDLFGNAASSNPELPTLNNCLKYHTLIWTGYKEGTAVMNYVVQARCGDSLDTDSAGKPLDAGWLDITQHTVVYNTDGAQGTTGQIGGTAAGHFRVVVRLPDGLYFDQYRILLAQASGTQKTHHKIVGVRR